jgi:hypothetical protein
MSIKIQTITNEDLDDFINEQHYSELATKKTATLYVVATANLYERFFSVFDHKERKEFKLNEQTGEFLTLDEAIKIYNSL